MGGSAMNSWMTGRMSGAPGLPIRSVVLAPRGRGATSETWCQTSRSRTWIAFGGSLFEERLRLHEHVHFREALTRNGWSPLYVRWRVLRRSGPMPGSASGMSPLGSAFRTTSMRTEPSSQAVCCPSVGLDPPWVRRQSTTRVERERDTKPWCVARMARAVAREC